MNFIKKDLAPGITVYRTDFKDLSKSLDIIKNSVDKHTILFNVDSNNKEQHGHEAGGWKAKQANLPNEQIKTDIYYVNLEYLKNNGFSDQEEVVLTDKIKEIYALCFNDYTKTMNNEGVHLPYIKDYDANSSEWLDQDFSMHIHKAQKPDFCLELWENEKNGNAINISEGLNLGWHFDEHKFQDIEDYRHAVTGNIYLNDDYESGRIMFLYGNDWSNYKNFDNLSIIAYKPMAGDIIIYPAFWPVAHSVTIPFNKDRYMISKIWKYMYRPGDFSLEVLEYCKELYKTISNTNSSLAKAIYTIPKERFHSINGKDFWYNDEDSGK